MLFIGCHGARALSSGAARRIDADRQLHACLWQRAKGPVHPQPQGQGSRLRGPDGARRAAQIGALDFQAMLGKYAVSNPTCSGTNAMAAGIEPDTQFSAARTAAVDPSSPCSGQLPRPWK